MWSSGRQITLLRQGPDGKLGPRDAGKRARLKAGLLPPGKLWTWCTAVIREAVVQWQSQARMARMNVQGHFQLTAVMNPATDKHMLTTMLAIDYLNSSNPTPQSFWKRRHSLPWGAIPTLLRLQRLALPENKDLSSLSSLTPTQLSAPLCKAHPEIIASRDQTQPLLYKYGNRHRFQKCRAKSLMGNSLYLGKKERSKGYVYGGRRNFSFGWSNN